MLKDDWFFLDWKGVYTILTGWNTLVAERQVYLQLSVTVFDVTKQYQWSDNTQNGGITDQTIDKRLCLLYLLSVCEGMSVYTFFVSSYRKTVLPPRVSAIPISSTLSPGNNNRCVYRFSFFCIACLWATQKIQLFGCNVQYARFVLYGECVHLFLAVNGGIRSSSFAVVVYIFYFVFVCNTLRVTDRSNEFSSGTTIPSTSASPIATERIGEVGNIACKRIKWTVIPGIFSSEKRKDNNNHQKSLAATRLP